jgi:serine/threonine-protein kinase
MAAFGSEQTGRVLGGRYRVLGAVGSGSSATVYVAEDVQLRRRVAVKILHPTLADDTSFLKRFRAEARAAAGLSHPNIMAVFDWGEDHEGSRPTPYLVLEYLGGGSLRAMLDRGRRLSASQALLVGLEAARGLDYAHRRGLVHRDVKPANLLFGEDGRLRIADFGLARAIAEAAWTEPAGVVLGTARYASPEQAKGLSVDGKTDVYSLALSLVEAVTGHVPFAADTTVATLMNRLDKLMPVSADLGPLAAVLERAGRPWPEERFDAGELARALVQTAERLPRPAPLPLVPTAADSGTHDTMLPEAAPAAYAPPMASAPAASGGPPSGRLVPRAPAAPPTTATPLVTSGRPLTAAPYDAEAEPDSLPEPIVDLPAERRPRSKLRAFLGLLAVVLVGAAVAGGVVFVPKWLTPTYAVPDLRDVEIGSAENQIAPNGWKVETTETNDELIADRHIISQIPEPGVKMKKGKTISFVVSKGPAPRSLPELTGKSGDEAKATLQQLGLVYNEAGKTYDENAPVGTVMSFTVGGQSVPVSSPVLKGAQVDVIVSNGPAPRTIPKLAGKTVDEAKAALDAIQLVANPAAEQFSDTVPAGTVISIDPKAGQTIDRGGTVNLTVSKGPDVVTVPNVVGMTLADATAQLNGAGLAVGDVAGPPEGKVQASGPSAGAVLKRNSIVNLLMQ